MFNQCLEALARIDPDGEGVAVHCLDLDHFMNETLGHPMGIGSCKMWQSASYAASARMTERVRAEGCTEVRAFYFSPPPPASELAPLLPPKAATAVA